MKIKILALFLLLGSLVFAQYPANLFCNAEGLLGEPAGGIYGYNDWFTNVSFAGINNSAVKGGWITRYTAVHGSVRRGETYTLSVTVNSAGADFSYQYIGAYIDWNRDGDCGTRSGERILDVGEGYEVGKGGTHPATMTKNITVPLNAAIGTTWLRVMLDGDTPGGVGDYECLVGYGEIKDFPIDVLEALPVELTSFTASASNGIISLNWQTANEINNFGFEVERKLSDKSDWENIGFVSGNGNSNSLKEYSFTDPLDLNLNLNLNLKYRLKQIDTDGKFEYSKEISVETDLSTPKEFALSQNYPNPFNPSTVISYELPVMSNVSLKVFDMIGNEVATLVNEEKPAGYHSVTFEAGKLASGVYMYQLTAGDFSVTKKLILTK